MWAAIPSWRSGRKCSSCYRSWRRYPWRRCWNRPSRPISSITKIKSRIWTCPGIGSRIYPMNSSHLSRIWRQDFVSSVVIFDLAFLKNILWFGLSINQSINGFLTNKSISIDGYSKKQIQMWFLAPSNIFCLLTLTPSIRTGVLCWRGSLTKFTTTRASHNDPNIIPGNKARTLSSFVLTLWQRGSLFFIQRVLLTSIRRLIFSFRFFSCYCRRWFWQITSCVECRRRWACQGSAKSISATTSSPRSRTASSTPSPHPRLTWSRSSSTPTRGIVTAESPVWEDGLYVDCFSSNCSMFTWISVSSSSSIYWLIDWLIDWLIALFFRQVPRAIPGTRPSASVPATSPAPSATSPPRSVTRPSTISPSSSSTPARPWTWSRAAVTPMWMSSSPSSSAWSSSLSPSSSSFFGTAIGSTHTGLTRRSGKTAMASTRTRMSGTSLRRFPPSANPKTAYPNKCRRSPPYPNKSPRYKVWTNCFFYFGEHLESEKYLVLLTLVKKREERRKKRRAKEFCHFFSRFPW